MAHNTIPVATRMTQQEVNELISCVCEVSGFETMKNAQALRYCITFFKRHHNCTKQIDQDEAAAEAETAEVAEITAQTSTTQTTQVDTADTSEAK